MTCIVFSANQLCHESQTSGVGASQRPQFLVLTKRVAASGHENDLWCNPHNIHPEEGEGGGGWGQCSCLE